MHKMKDLKLCLWAGCCLNGLCSACLTLGFAQLTLELIYRKVNRKFSFFGLRDSHGTTQLFVPSESATDVLSAMRDVPTESTVLITGIVRARPESQRRPVS